MLCLSPSFIKSIVRVVAFCSPEQGCGVYKVGCEEDAGGLLGGNVAIFRMDVRNCGSRVGWGEKGHLGRRPSNL